MTTPPAPSQSSTASDVPASAASLPFRLSASDYVRRAGLRWLGRWWWAWALPAAVMLAMAFADAVWLFVFFMVVCMLYPGLVMMLFYHYALSPEARRSIEEHTVTADRSGLTLAFDNPRLQPVTYPYSAVTGVAVSRRFLVIDLDKPRYNHIAIPVSALPDGADTAMLAVIDRHRPDLAQ